MKRRQFLKGIGLISLSPLVAKVEYHKQAVEFIANSGKPIFWTELSASDIVADIKAARDRIRNATGNRHDSYSVCLPNGKTFDISNL